MTATSKKKSEGKIVDINVGGQMLIESNDARLTTQHDTDDLNKTMSSQSRGRIRPVHSAEKSKAHGGTFDVTNMGAVHISIQMGSGVIRNHGRFATEVTFESNDSASESSIIDDSSLEQ
jgi:hypothetical protein